MGDLEHGEGDQPQVPNSGVSATHDHAGPPPKKPRRRVDWREAERLYVHGHIDGDEHRWPSLGEVAEKVGASKRQAEYHSARKDWNAKRDHVRGEVTVAAVKRDLARRLEEADKAGQKSVAIGKASLGLAAVWISKAHQAGTVEPKELDYIVNAARKAHALVREGLGIPVDLFRAAEEEVRRQRETGGSLPDARVDAEARAFIDAVIARVKDLPPAEFTAVIDELLPTPPGHNRADFPMPPAPPAPPQLAAISPAAAQDDEHEEDDG